MDSLWRSRDTFAEWDAEWNGSCRNTATRISMTIPAAKAPDRNARRRIDSASSCGTPPAPRVISGAVSCTRGDDAAPLPRGRVHFWTGPDIASDYSEARPCVQSPGGPAPTTPTCAWAGVVSFLNTQARSEQILFNHETEILTDMQSIRVVTSIQIIQFWYGGGLRDARRDCSRRDAAWVGARRASGIE